MTSEEKEELRLLLDQLRGTFLTIELYGRDSCKCHFNQIIKEAGRGVATIDVFKERVQV